MTQKINGKSHLSYYRQQILPEIQAINESSSFFEIPSLDLQSSSSSECNGQVQSLENYVASRPILAQSVAFPQNFPNDIQ